MKNANLILLVVIILIGAGNLVKVFTFDTHLREVSKALKKTETELENALKSNKSAQDQIQNLKTDIESYELKNEKLQLTIDSIVLVKRAKAPKDWKDRQNIKQQQQRIRDRLRALRAEDNEFQH